MAKYYAVYIEDSVNFKPDVPVAMFLITETKEGSEWAAAYRYGEKYGVGKVSVRVKTFRIQ